MLPGPAVPGCCLVSFHFLWAILSTSTVPSLSFGLELLTKLRLRHYDQSPRLFMNLCSTQCSLIVGVSLPLSIRLFVFAPNQRVMAVPMTALLAHSLLEEMEQLRWTSDRRKAIIRARNSETSSATESPRYGEISRPISTKGSIE